MGQVRLQWRRRVTADAQRVYRSDAPFDAGSLPEALAELAADADEFVDGEAPAGNLYYAIGTVLTGSPMQVALSSVISVLVEEGGASGSGSGGSGGSPVGWTGPPVYIGSVAGSLAADASFTPVAVDVSGLSLQQGDVLLLAVASDVSLSAWSPPAGWSVLFYDVTDVVLGVFYKVVGATPDTSVDVLTESGRRVVYSIRAYRGAQTDQPFEEIVRTSGSSGRPDAGSNFAATSSFRILIGALDDDDVEMTAPAGFGNLSAVYAGLSVNAAGGDGASLAVCDLTGGAAVQNPAAFGGSGSDFWVALHFGLRPADPTGSVTGAAVEAVRPIFVVKPKTGAHVEAVRPIFVVKPKTGAHVEAVRPFYVVKPKP